MYFNTPIYKKNSPLIENEMTKNTPIINSSYNSSEKTNSNLNDSMLKPLKLSFTKAFIDKDTYYKYSPIIKSYIIQKKNELFESFEKKRSKSAILYSERIRKKILNRNVVKTLKIKFTPKIKIKKKESSFYMRKKIKNCLIKWIQIIKEENYINSSYSNNEIINTFNYFSEEKCLKSKNNNDNIAKDLLPSFDKEINNENMENKIIVKVVKYKDLNFMNSKKNGFNIISKVIKRKYYKLFKKKIRNLILKEAMKKNTKKIFTIKYSHHKKFQKPKLINLYKRLHLKKYYRRWKKKILLEYTHTSEEKKDLIIKYSPVKVIPNENYHHLRKKSEKKKKDLTIKNTPIKMLKNTTNNNNYSLNSKNFQEINFVMNNNLNKTKINGKEKFEEDIMINSNKNLEEEKTKNKNLIIKFNPIKSYKNKTINNNEVNNNNKIKGNKTIKSKKIFEKLIQKLNSNKNEHLKNSFKKWRKKKYENIDKEIIEEDEFNESNDYNVRTPSSTKRFNLKSDISPNNNLKMSNEKSNDETKITEDSSFLNGSSDNNYDIKETFAFKKFNKFDLEKNDFINEEIKKVNLDNRIIKKNFDIKYNNKSPINIFRKSTNDLYVKIIIELMERKNKNKLMKKFFDVWSLKIQNKYNEKIFRLKNIILKEIIHKYFNVWKEKYYNDIKKPKIIRIFRTRNIINKIRENEILKRCLFKWINISKTIIKRNNNFKNKILKIERYYLNKMKITNFDKYKNNIKTIKEDEEHKKQILSYLYQKYQIKNIRNLLINKLKIWINQTRKMKLIYDYQTLNECFLFFKNKLILNAFKLIQKEIIRLKNINACKQNYLKKVIKNKYDYRLNNLQKFFNLWRLNNQKIKNIKIISTVKIYNSIDKIKKSKSLKKYFIFLKQNFYNKPQNLKSDSKINEKNKGKNNQNQNKKKRKSNKANVQIKFSLKNIMLNNYNNSSNQNNIMKLYYILDHMIKKQIFIKLFNQNKNDISIKRKIDKLDKLNHLFDSIMKKKKENSIRKSFNKLKNNLLTSRLKTIIFLQRKIKQFLSKRQKDNNTNLNTILKKYYLKKEYNRKWTLTLYLRKFKTIIEKNNFNKKLSQLQSIFKGIIFRNHLKIIRKFIYKLNLIRNNYKKEYERIFIQNLKKRQNKLLFLVIISKKNNKNKNLLKKYLKLWLIKVNSIKKNNEKSKVIQFYLRKQLLKKYLNNLIRHNQKKFYQQINYIIKNQKLKNILLKKMLKDSVYKWLEITKKLYIDDNNYKKIRNTLKKYEKQNINIFIIKLFKLYSYQVLNKFFNLIKSKIQINNKNIFQKIKYYCIPIKSKIISNENNKIQLIHFKFKGKSRKIKNQKSNKNTISFLLPSFIKYLDIKMYQKRKKTFHYLYKYSIYKHLIELLFQYTNKKLLYKQYKFFSKLRKNKSEIMNEESFDVIYKKILTRKLTTTLKISARLNNIIYLMNLTEMHKKIAFDIYRKKIIKTWRLFAFYKLMKLKKMKLMYQNYMNTFMNLSKELFGNGFSEEKSIQICFAEFLEKIDFINFK